jgi:hypothetical protein
MFQFINKSIPRLSSSLILMLLLSSATTTGDEDSPLFVEPVKLHTPLKVLTNSFTFRYVRSLLFN